MWIGGWLRDQDVRASFHEVMTADVCHDLRAGQEFCVKLLLDLVELLRGPSVPAVRPSMADCLTATS